MREAVIVASSRTPLAKSHRGSFNLTRPDDLAAHCIRHVLGKDAAARRAGDRRSDPRLRPAARCAGTQRRPRRRAAGGPAGDHGRRHGQPVLQFGPAGDRAGGAHGGAEGVEAAIGGGVESITMMQRDNSPNPWLVEHYPGLYMAMGETAEVVAKRYGITREAQDEYALLSQQRTARAQHGRLLRRRAGADRRHSRRARQEDRRENRRGSGAVDRDECNRPDTTLEGLARSCRRSSTRPAARGASPPATRRSSPMARRRRSSCRWIARGARHPADA